MRNFWDFAWEEPLVGDFVRFDVDGASYCGAARHSADYYAALHAAGIDVLGIMETTNGRAQEGYNAGAYDVDFARRRWREVGFPDSAPMAYAVSDGSRDDPSSNGDQITQYGEAVGDHEVGPYKFYGNRYAVDAACEGARRSMHLELCLNLNGGWVPRTWNFDESRDTAAQEVGGTPVGGIDVNTLYRPIFGGVTPTPKPTPKTKGNDMDLVLAKGDGVWVKNNQFWVIGPGDQAQHVGVELDGTPQPLPQVIADWGWLGEVGALPAVQVDRYVTNAIQAYVRNKKLDKQLLPVTLP